MLVAALGAIAVPASGWAAAAPPPAARAAAAPQLTASIGGVTATAVTLSGTVDPLGERGTAHFEWGVSAAYTDRSSDIELSGPPLPVSTTVTGLAPATAYHYRLVAMTAGGTAQTPDQTFTTPALPAPPPPPPPPALAPSVQTGVADALAPTSASLHGNVDSRGAAGTTVRFEYGSPGEATTTFSASQPVSGVGAIAVAAAITGLAPATSYRFRVLATNAAGTATGAWAAFATPRPAAPPDRRPPHLSLARHLLRVDARGRVLVPLRCPRDEASCRGSFRMLSLLGERLAQGSLVLRGGQVARARVRLPSRIRRALAHNRVAVRIRASATDAAGNAGQVVLPAALARE